MPISQRGRRLGGAGAMEVPDEYAHWRILISATEDNNWANVGELQFRTQAGISEVPSGGTPSASSTFSGMTAANAFDGSAGTQWNSANNTVPHWLRYSFAVARQVVQVAIQARSSGATTATPKDFKVQASANGTDWVDLLTVTNQTGWATSEVRTFNL